MELEFLTPKPKIILRNYFKDPYKIVIASAKGCYSSRTRTIEEVTEDDIKKIGKSVYEGGHHTVFEHAVFGFSIDDISRRASYELCNFPFYNTSQQSQRYVELKKIKIHMPPISGENKSAFEKAVKYAWNTYNFLSDILFKHFSNKFGEKFSESALKKRAIEEARYVIPQAATTSMFYTINGLTLHRLNKMRNATDVPYEFGIITDKMIDEVNKIGPLFFKNIEDPYPMDKILEDKFIKKYKPKIGSIKEFDKKLNGKKVKLVGYTKNAEEIVADSIRAVLGLDNISDKEILDEVLDPAKNSYLTGKLEVMMHSPICRALHHLYCTFYESLSHTADHQNIRHRQTPASRQLYSYTDTKEPDCLMPKVFEELPEAKQIYNECINELWEVKNNLIDNGVKPEFVQYLYPNAKKMRIVESGSLMNYIHKFKLRSCNRAQKEIHDNSIEKLQQLTEMYPNLFKFVGPPCKMRERAGLRPYCLEGGLTCKEEPYNPPGMINR